MLDAPYPHAHLFVLYPVVSTHQHIMSLGSMRGLAGPGAARHLHAPPRWLSPSKLHGSASHHHSLSEHSQRLFHRCLLKTTIGVWIWVWVWVRVGTSWTTLHGMAWHHGLRSTHCYNPWPLYSSTTYEAMARSRPQLPANCSRSPAPCLTASPELVCLACR